MKRCRGCGSADDRHWEDCPEDVPRPVQAPCSVPIQQTIYDHGGSRIWRDKPDGGRELLADTYTDADFAEASLAFVEAWYRDHP